jgi:type IV pilus assembly protein PilV
MPGMSAQGRRPRRGLSLIEVLMVLMLFSFGLVGLVALQARAVQVSVSAEDSQRAALLASELATTMWGRRTVQLEPALVAAWSAQVADSTRRGLPNGAGTVVVNGNVARITVTWRAPHEPVAVVHRYVTDVQL